MGVDVITESRVVEVVQASDESTVNNFLTSPIVNLDFTYGRSKSDRSCWDENNGRSWSIYEDHLDLAHTLAMWWSENIVGDHMLKRHEVQSQSNADSTIPNRKRNRRSRQLITDYRRMEHSYENRRQIRESGQTTSPAILMTSVSNVGVLSEDISRNEAKNPQFLSCFDRVTENLEGAVRKHRKILRKTTSKAKPYYQKLRIKGVDQCSSYSLSSNENNKNLQTLASSLSVSQLNALRGLLYQASLIQAQYIQAGQGTPRIVYVRPEDGSSKIIWVMRPGRDGRSKRLKIKSVIPSESHAEVDDLHYDKESTMDSSPNAAELMKAAEGDDESEESREEMYMNEENFLLGIME
ncbi:hypothetical protein AB6A40_001119 [Gnathostoma spinigerum]|uniref:Uncharacterized protein n=1 Tax=Gnathostoma spinigerum TaxID=75299 RepID=A0ABD6E4G9_9BILA